MAVVLVGSLALLAGCGPGGDGAGRAAGGAAGGEAAAPGTGAWTDGGVADSVAAMLDSTAAAWNRGDLEGFLAGYADDEATSFAGGDGVIRSLDSVRARYRRSYWASGSPTDSLRFDSIRARPLGPAHVLATGRFVLRAPAADSVASTGWFSLVLERRGRDGGWRILHDHTSASR